MTKSWKTTVLGLIAVLTALGGAATAILDGNAATNPNWETVISAVMAGIGLIFAKDSNVSGTTPPAA